jgi:uncharacterized membrane protein YesL
MSSTHRPLLHTGFLLAGYIGTILYIYLFIYYVYYSVSLFNIIDIGIIYI